LLDIEDLAGGATVGTYARLYWQKGADVLIEAMALLCERRRDVTCRITGDGPLRVELQALIGRRQLGGIIELVPDPRDARAVLSSLDIFVLPSRTETYPLGLLEAMAAGRSVIGAAVGAVPQIIDHGRNGLVVAPERPAELAAAIERLCADDELRLRLGQAAREKARRDFDIARTAKRLEIVYAHVVAARRQPPKRPG
jgi:glycosyltransferase involved in cell wall biosynthesis